jgi:small-conductance mechanosensitive channel
MISMVVFYFIIINVLVSALTQAKVNTVFLSQNISLVIGGVILAFAIGYGLASKDSVANFLASQYIQDKVNPGDTIILDGVSGEVLSIDRSSVVIQTADGNMHIPLAHLSKSKLIVK